MAGSHRAPDPTPGRRLSIPVLAIAVGAAMLLVFVVWTALDEPDIGSMSPPPASPAAPTPSFPSLTPSPVSPIDDLPRIPGAPPRRLVIGEAVDAGFTNAVTSNDEVLQAPSPSKLARLEDRAEPGSPGKETVVILGQDRFDTEAALNDVGEVSEGDELRLETYNADLSYTVDSVFKVASESLRDTTPFRDTRPGRLLLIATTYDADGERTGTETVVVAHLTDAEAR